jgi:uncharacterized protein YdeI (YjbR/CyaY-like superfamily)
MKITRTCAPPDRASWRAWLEKHAAVETEIWLVYYKAAAKKPTISYQDSLEEALCFGWVDSVIQRIDEERYARKFTPRRPGSRWSEANRRLAARLVKEGRLTPAGLARLNSALPAVDASRHARKTAPLPGWLKSGLRTSPRAWANFEALPPSHRRRYIGWISQAKREETRLKRLREAIILLAENKRLGLGPGEVRK